MYTDSRITYFQIRWTDICVHNYERISRPKWCIKLHYACGAEMTIENLPDDLIQCLVVGAFNSGKDIKTNLKEAPAAERGGAVLGSWREVEPVLLG